MLLQIITSDEFEGLLQKHQILFIDFWAEWCEPCKVFGKIYEQVAIQQPDIQFAKINVEEAVELAQIFQIRSIPHLMVFKQGLAIYSEVGSMPQTTLNELVQQARNADISKILAKIDERE